MDLSLDTPAHVHVGRQELVAGRPATEVNGVVSVRLRDRIPVDLEVDLSPEVTEKLVAALA